MYPGTFGPSAWGTLIELTYSSYKHIKRIEEDRKRHPSHYPKEDDNIDQHILPTYEKLVYNTDCYSIRDTKLAVFAFINLFYLIISCKTCSKDTRKYVKENPFPINNPDAWMKWIYDFKSYVNFKTNNKSSLSFKEFEHRISFFSSVAPDNIFKLVLIVSANLDYIYDKNMPVTEIKELYRRFKILFASMFVLFHFAPTLTTAAPFILLSNWNPGNKIDHSMFSAAFKSATRYEIETQSVSFLKHEKGLPSAQVDKKEYIPIIFEPTESACFKKYRYTPSK